jgi:hypothetical protein
LATKRQTASVSNTTVATEIHQSLDVHRRLAAKITLNHEICDCCTQVRDLRFSEIFHFRIGRNASRFANLRSACTSDTIDRGQRNHDVLVNRYVYACYSSHFNYLCLLSRQLTLTLLMTFVGADHAHNSAATDDLAVSAHFSY